MKMQKLKCFDLKRTVIRLSKPVRRILSMAITNNCAAKRDAYVALQEPIKTTNRQTDQEIAWRMNMIQHV